MKNKGRKRTAGFLSEILIGVLMGVTMLPVGISMLFITMRAQVWELFIIFPAVLIEYFLLTAAHEAGHLIFGLISGYGFCSYRIGGLMWIKLPEGIRLRRFSIAGTGGQCLMIPPKESNGKIPVFLYNLGGALVNLALAVLLFVAYIFTRGISILPDILIMGAEFSLIMAVFNGLPMKVGGIDNDGMNAFSLRKDTMANEAFRKQLLINAEQTRGVRLSDMPQEWFALAEGADMNNPLCAAISAFYCNRLMDSEKFDEAEKRITELINGDNGLAGVYRGILISDLIYCLLLKGENERAAKYYTKEQRAVMNALKEIPGILRTEYALAICKIKGAKDASRIKKVFEKVTKKYPYSTDVELERRLINLIENR